MKVTWTEQAWDRLLEIERFVARDDPRAAVRLVDKLIDRGDALAEHPERGRRLSELPESGLPPQGQRMARRLVLSPSTVKGPMAGQLFSARTW